MSNWKAGSSGLSFLTLQGHRGISSPMDYRDTTALTDLELMVLDETAEPKALPLSLLESITNRFSSDREIGRGGFAVVYKGVLGNGTLVAVKRLSNMYMHEKKFHGEVECLMKGRHKNIVRFLGYCADTQGNMMAYNGKLVMADIQERLLCFEYVPNGSLRDYINGKSCGHEWRKCCQIIKGICHGLNYLHENRIVHLDLKPENVLLDGNMVPKITDFGLSRCFEENQTSQSMTSNLCGTLGYIAPELHNRQKITIKSDLYSLGIIIIELLTGQKGYPDDVEAVLKSWCDRLEKTSRDTQLEQVRVCIDIGIECSEFNPAKRPASTHKIIERLTKIEDADEVQEELPAGLVRSLRYMERSSPETSPPPLPPSAERATWRLAFVNPPQLPIYTGSKIEDANGNPLQVILVDAGTGSPSSQNVPMFLLVELVPLFGDFPHDGREECASAAEFAWGVVKERAGKRPLLTGDVALTMRDGRAVVGELQFTDNSSWLRCRKFRIGARVVPGSGYEGPRVAEAMTEAFNISSNRGGLYRKHYPPALGDDVWRLENIDKEGALHRKLAQANVRSVQDFLQMLTVKPDMLRVILGDGMTDRMWVMTRWHARKCEVGDKVYAYAGQPGGGGATVYVNSVFQLVKIKVGGVECAPQQLNRAQKQNVQQLLLEAFEQRAHGRLIGV